MRRSKRWLSGVFVGALVANGFWSSSPAYAVGTRRVGIRSAQDFKEGELKGVAVDATGQVRAGYNLGQVPVVEATSVWAALPLGGDRLLLTTGHEGRLFEYNQGAVKEVAKADAMVLTAITKAFGTVLVASLPEGTLYEYKNGALTEWLKLPDTEHIFALAYDGQALFAGTGPEGKLYRITRDKKAQVFFDAEEQHIMSVATHRGKVFAGASDRAKLYELSGPGRARVLHDFGLTEVRAIEVAANGDIYAVANEVKGRGFPSSKKSKSAKDSKSSSSSTKGKGVLYRFKDDTPEQLLEEDSEHFVSLALDHSGRPFVGTGVEGRVYTVDAQHNSVLMADTEERQVAAFVLGKGQQFVIGSDPVVVHPVRGIGGAEAVWTSKVIDLGIQARFGQLDWTADGQIEMSTRSGNTEEPDDTWSPWSAPLKNPGEITSPRGRFLQVRSTFRNDKDAVLSEVVIPFVTDNLRAVINSVDAKTPSAEAISDADGKIETSGGPITKGPDHSVELSWKVDNPDKDPLRFRLQYQMVGTRPWYDILEPHEKLTKTSYSWDTSDLPEGKYRVRVEATDEAANPPERTTRHQLTSNVVVVDNTPPEVQGLSLVGGSRRVRGVALDGVGPIARIEYAVAGTDEWHVVVPKDGVFDETSEEFEFDASVASPSGPALLAVRVYDAENNVVVRSISLR